MRWDGGRPAYCPLCRAPDRCYFLAPADGYSRATRTGARTARRVWRCGACRGQFSVLTGTVFEGTRIALTTWLAAVTLTGAGELPGAAELSERLSVSRATARQVRARLAAALAELPE